MKDDPPQLVSKEVFDSLDEETKMEIDEAIMLSMYAQAQLPKQEEPCKDC